VDFMTEDSVMAMLRSTFQADAAPGAQVCFEVHVAGVVVHALVDHGGLTLHRGPTSDADAVIDAGAALDSLLTGELSAADALVGGQVDLNGPPELLSWFVTMFHQPALPTPLAA